MDLLPLFGCTPNNRNDYSFVDANTSEEMASREAAAIEFRQFYDEIKKTKNVNLIIMEYFLNVSYQKLIKSMLILFFVDFSIQILVLFVHDCLNQLIYDNNCYIKNKNLFCNC